MLQLVPELWFTGRAFAPDTHRMFELKNEWVLSPIPNGQQGDFIAIIKMQGLFHFSFVLDVVAGQGLWQTMQRRRKTRELRRRVQTL